METKKINYKSDFDFILTVVDSSGTDVGFPSYDWEARLRTRGNSGFSARSFIVSCIGGVCTNCFNDNGRIHVVADSHGLGTGMLHVEFHAHVPNGIYPDGEQLTVSPQSVDIELVTGMGDVATDLEVEVQVPYIWQSAYDMAVSQGYGGTMAEYIAAAAQLPGAVETATAIHDSVEVLEAASQSVEASAQALEMLSSEWAEGRRAIADALTARDCPTAPGESFHAMARKITGMSYGAGWLAEIGYTEGNCDIRERVQYARDVAKGWNPDGSTAGLFYNNKRLVFLPLLDTSAVTTMSSMFQGCSALSAIPWLDTSAVTNMQSMFYGCSALSAIPWLDTSAVTTMSSMFYGCSALSAIPLLDTSAVRGMSHVFYQCVSLSRIEGIDMSSVTNATGILSGCSALGFALMRNIGKSTLTAFDFSSATVWGLGSEENRQSVIDSLITYSYDRAAAGMSAVTIKLSANTKGLLTEEEIAQITAKGFTIA